MPRASNEGIIPNLWSLSDLTRPVSTSVSNPAILPAASSNGEVEGPADHVSQARRARNFDWAPARPTTSASRPPPTIVRRRGPSDHANSPASDDGAQSL